MICIVKELKLEVFIPSHNSLLKVTGSIQKRLAAKTVNFWQWNGEWKASEPVMIPHERPPF